MANIRWPRQGTMQFWPRKRAKRIYTKVRAWPNSNEAKALGFAGYKAGMFHAMLTDNRKNSLTKGETISFPVTVIECPSIKVIGIHFYKTKNKNLILSDEIIFNKLDKEIGRKLSLPKKAVPEKKFAEAEQKINDYSELRLLVSTQPRLTGIGKRKPEVFELAIGGKINEQLVYAKQVLGKELRINDVVKEGQLLDIHAVTKGKGFQGAVKRFGIALKQHKSEKGVRTPGSLGGWKAQGHTMYRVAHAGQMGYHTRTEYNKWLLKIGKNPEEVNKKGGMPHYGFVKNDYILVKGSIAGPQKRLVRFNPTIRGNDKVPTDAPAIEQIVL